MKKTILGIITIGSILFTSCEKKEALKTSEAGEVATATDSSEDYNVDLVESRVDWRGYKIIESENKESGHYGFIKLKSGTFHVENGHITAGKFVIDATTLESADLNDDPEKKAKLDGHLKSEDFLHVEEYPVATFEITGTKQIEGDYNTEVSGNLDMRGTPKQITFKANVGIKDGVLEMKTEEFTINRQDFGITFKGGQGSVIKDNVSMQVYLRALPAGQDMEAANNSANEDLGH